VDPAQTYPLPEALDLLKKLPAAGFDETVELAVSTGLNPKKADQAVRGTIALPKGIGKTLRVIAFCPDDQAEAAKEAGAAEAGGEDLVQKVNDGWLDFDVAVAHPSMMRFVGKLGRLLGPKGLMPSPKSGTVTDDVAGAVAEFAAGKIEYRTDAGGNIHAPVGKKSFPVEDLQANVEAFLDQLRRARPSTVKGRYIRGASVSSSMSPGVKITV
jgi:large subunit ribosomal protein L1